MVKAQNHFIFRGFFPLIFNVRLETIKPTRMRPINFKRITFCVVYKLLSADTRLIHYHSTHWNDSDSVCVHCTFHTFHMVFNLFGMVRNAKQNIRTIFQFFVSFCWFDANEFECETGSIPHENCYNKIFSFRKRIIWKHGMNTWLLGKVNKMVILNKCWLSTNGYFPFSVLYCTHNVYQFIR